MRPLLSLLLVFFTAVNAIHDSLINKIRKHFSSFKPEAIIDVGANTGAFSANLRKHFPEAAILMVEASTYHDSKLKTVAEELGNAEHRIAVLSSKAGTVVQWFQNDQNPSGTGNSMYRVRQLGQHHVLVSHKERMMLIARNFCHHFVSLL
jgi:hypothetical protein